MPEKLDLYKEHSEEYVAKQTPTVIRIKSAKYLAIDGKGEPGGKEFQDCIGALYAIAFTIKMAKKFAGRDYRVSHLEGLWWNPPEDSECRWKLLIRVPEFIKQNDVDTAVDVSIAKGRHSLAESVKLETLKEGTVVQALHVGPYAGEAETIRRMQEVAVEQGFKMAGPLHEIYLSDPRRVEPDKIKTILREPVVRTPSFGYE